MSHFKCFYVYHYQFLLKLLSGQNRSIMIAFRSIGASLATLVLAIHPQEIWADQFSAAEVLTWDIAAQDSYFNTSMSMIAIVATQTGRDARISECLNRWYWTPEGANPAKNTLIRDTMERLPSYHPQAVILAVAQKHCGTFGAE